MYHNVSSVQGIADCSITVCSQCSGPETRPEGRPDVGTECTHHLMYVVPTTNIICNVVHRIGKDRQTERGKAPSGVGTNDIGKAPKLGLRTRKGQPGVIMVVPS